MINYRQPQEEIMSYYEIFSKYNQDVKFVGSFERYQREVSPVPENALHKYVLCVYFVCTYI